MKDQDVGRRAEERVRQARDAFAADYRAYQYRFVEFIIEHLCDVSRAFRGDLQAMIVLALVGQVHMRAMRAANAAGLDPRDLPPERLSITASRIADATDIPRETVRRKLALLQRKGWVRRNGGCGYGLVVVGSETAARADLAEIDARAMERVARLFRDLEAVVAAAADPPPAGAARPD